MKKQNDLNLQGPILSWDEALPLGNGTLGCLVWGKLPNLRFSIDKAGLWDLTPAPQTQCKDFTYQTMCRMVREEKWQELKDLFDAPYAQATPTKLPVGAVTLAGLPDTSYEGYLSLEDATATIRWENGSVQTWMAATEPVLVIQIQGDFSPELRYQPPAYVPAGEKYMDPLCRSLADLGYPPPQLLEDGFLQEISDGRCYCVLSKKVVTTGQTVFLLTVREGESIQTTLQQARVALSSVDLDALRERHIAWWRDFWNQSALSLPDRQLEQMWYLGNYFLGSGSRPGQAPMPLQGVWTADQNALPPWKGDYHNDLNTQFTYSGYLTANHLPQGEAFLEYLWNLLPTAKTFAKAFYGTDGACFPGVMALDGSPLGGWPMYSLSPTNTIWLAQLFYDHYRITGDRDYLRQRVWPFFLATETCIGSLLEEDEKGFLHLPLSSSPEINDDTPQSWLPPNSNYDLALLRYLYETLCKMAVELGEPEECWKQKLAHLAWPCMEADGTLMIAQGLSVTESHRHFSHAMAIYPLRQISWGSPENKEIIRKTVCRLRELGTSQWVGFSFVWYALLNILQKDGEEANRALQDFARGFLSPNGFHLNGDYRNLGLSDFHYRPFTLEANMLAVQAVSEMLLYSQDGELEIFPAIPADWKTIAFSGLRGEQGLLISAEKEENTITLQLEAERQGSWYLRNIGEQITLRPGEKKTILWRTI